jgi:hypothetical protein
MGEDSKERASKDQARVKGKQWLGCQRTKAMAKKRVLALSFGTHQAMKSHIVRGSNYSWIIGRSDLMPLSELICLKLDLVTCSRRLCSNERDELVVTLNC